VGLFAWDESSGRVVACLAHTEWVDGALMAVALAHSTGLFDRDKDADPEAHIIGLVKFCRRYELPLEAANGELLRHALNAAAVVALTKHVRTDHTERLHKMLMAIDACEVRDAVSWPGDPFLWRLGGRVGAALLTLRRQGNGWDDTEVRQIARQIIAEILNTQASIDWQITGDGRPAWPAGTTFAQIIYEGLRFLISGRAPVACDACHQVVRRRFTLAQSSSRRQARYCSDRCQKRLEMRRRRDRQRSYRSRK